MINSSPAANSKPIITVNTHAFASVNPCTYTNRCRRTDTHRHYNADILASLQLQKTLSQCKERPQSYAETWPNAKTNAYTHTCTHSHTPPKASRYSSWIFHRTQSICIRRTVSPHCVSTLLEQILNWAKGTSRTALASNFSPILRSPPRWPTVWHSHIHRANDSLPATQLYNCPGGIEISLPPWSLALLCGT